ncbi:MAG: hypothetical protein QOD74_1040 [Variibacter sp.]|nr:hypothetical protein [Variibacter sp.]
MLLRPALVAVAMWFGVTSANAAVEKRVALVIGNSTYQNAAKLANPSNDALAVSDMFQRIGFEVVELHTDVSATQMRRVLRDFTQTVQGAEVAVVYYAGHGMEVSNRNYLVPVDAMLKRDVDVEDEAISLDRVLQILEPAKRLRLVILDACRDNPFLRTMTRTTGITRTFGRGLARIEPSTLDTVVLYAAKDGSTAADGDGENSPFTSALLKFLPSPGLDVQKAMRFIRDDVLAATGKRQEPFHYGSIGGEELALVPGASPVLASASFDAKTVGPILQSVNAPGQTERDFQLASAVGSKEAWDAFLTAHPRGFHADLARVQRTKLAKVTTATPAAEPKPGSMTTAAVTPVPRLEEEEATPTRLKKSSARERSSTREKSSAPARRTRSFAARTDDEPRSRKAAKAKPQKKERTAKRGRGGGGQYCGYVGRSLQAAAGMGWNTKAGLLGAGRSYCGG